MVRPDESLQFIPPGEGEGTSHGARVDVTVHQLGEHPIHRGLPRSWMAADIEVYSYGFDARMFYYDDAVPDIDNETDAQVRKEAKQLKAKLDNWRTPS